MKTSWRQTITRLIAVTLFLSGIKAYSQFDDEKDMDLTEDSQAAVPVTKLEVDSKDIKILNEVHTTKSEEAMLQAASHVLGVDAHNLVALNTLGVFYFEQGKYGLSRMILNRALQTHKDVPALHNNLGVVYMAEGKQRQGLAEFRAALELKSDYRIAAANLGAILLEYKDFERALKPLEAGYKATRGNLKSGTNNAMEVANNYAIALTGAGQFDEAKAVYEEIIAGSTRNPTVLLNYAILLVEKQKNYKEASKLLSRIKFAVEDGKVLKRVEELEAKINSAEK